MDGHGITSKSDDKGSTGRAGVSVGAVEQTGRMAGSKFRSSRMHHFSGCTIRILLVREECPKCNCSQQQEVDSRFCEFRDGVATDGLDLLESRHSQEMLLGILMNDLDPLQVRRHSNEAKPPCFEYVFPFTPACVVVDGGIEAGIDPSERPGLFRWSSFHIRKKQVHIVSRQHISALNR
jgi:hypothetical protein